MHLLQFNSDRRLVVHATQLPKTVFLFDIGTLLSGVHGVFFGGGGTESKSLAPLLPALKKHLSFLQARQGCNNKFCGFYG